MPAVKDMIGMTLYPTDRVSLAMLSDSDRGRLILVLFDLFDGVDSSSTLTPQAQMAFAFIGERIRQERQQRDHRREVNRSNAARRWSVREASGDGTDGEDG